jgi:hypothetical protein
MSKPALVKYRTCEAVESEKKYWYLNGETKVVCNLTDMKPGTEYYCGKVKQLGNEEPLYFYEFRI